MFSLYLDEDSMDHALVNSLRAQGFDVLTTAEARNRRRCDREQLTFAMERGRVIFTSNVRDFRRLNNDWLRSERHHAGIIVLADRRTSIGAQTRAFIRLIAAHSSETMQDRLEILDNWMT